MGLPLAFVLYIFSRGERERTPAGQQKRVVSRYCRATISCACCGVAMPAHRGHESAPQAETLYETVILTGLPPACRKRPAGGGIVHPVDKGGRGALSLLDESGEKGVYRSPPKKTKNGVAQVGAAGVAPHRAGVYHSSM